MCVARRRRCLDHRQQLWLSFATVTALASLIFASSTSALLFNPTQHLRRALGVKDKKVTPMLTWLEHGSGTGRVKSTESKLSGPGSWPPRCTSKCGNCWPCKPVRVSIQPGLSIPLEYYPEAWRCKCGNKLFMP